MFVVGDFMLVARGRKLWSISEVVPTTWTGAWRVAPGGLEHVCVLEDVVTGGPKKRMWHVFVLSLINLWLYGKV